MVQPGSLVVAYRRMHRVEDRSPGNQRTPPLPLSSSAAVAVAAAAAAAAEWAAAAAETADSAAAAAAPETLLCCYRCCYRSYRTYCCKPSSGSDWDFDGREEASGRLVESRSWRTWLYFSLTFMSERWDFLKALCQGHCEYH